MSNNAYHDGGKLCASVSCSFCSFCTNKTRFEVWLSEERNRSYADRVEMGLLEGDDGDGDGDEDDDDAVVGERRNF